MTTDETELLRRFLRTVRVATHTALAEYELGEAARSGAAPVRFHALAAKSADGWRFPETGLASADGLVTATLERADDGSPARLVLQAQGSAGLDLYAGRTGTIRFGAVVPGASASFNADGRAVVALDGLGLEEDDLASFEIEMVGTR